MKQYRTKTPHKQKRQIIIGVSVLAVVALVGIILAIVFNSNPSKVQMGMLDTPDRWTKTDTALIKTSLIDNTGSDHIHATMKDGTGLKTVMAVADHDAEVELTIDFSVASGEVKLIAVNSTTQEVTVLAEQSCQDTTKVLPAGTYSIRLVMRHADIELDIEKVQSQEE